MASLSHMYTNPFGLCSRSESCILAPGLITTQWLLRIGSSILFLVLERTLSVNTSSHLIIFKTLHQPAYIFIQE